jgi:hypothetical protein
LLNAPSPDEARKQRSVRRREVARCGSENECRDDEAPERQIAGKPRDGDGHEHGAAHEVRDDHRPAAVQAVRDEASV